MKQIKDILQNNKKTYIQTTTIQTICSDVISHILHITITPSKIQYKNSTITISAPPVIKTEIYIQQKKILKEINKQGITLTKIH